MSAPYTYAPPPPQQQQQQQQPVAYPAYAYAPPPPPPAPAPQPQVQYAPMPQPAPQVAAPQPQPAQPRPAAGAFDLDDLLGTGLATRPAVAPAAQAPPPPPPDYPPPPPVNHDPFFGDPSSASRPTAPVQQQQQQQPQPLMQPQYQAPAPAPQAYTYATQPQPQTVQQAQPQPAAVSYQYQPAQQPAYAMPQQQPQPLMQQQQQQQPQPQPVAQPYSYGGMQQPGAQPGQQVAASPLAGVPQAWHASAALAQPAPFHPGFDAASMNPRLAAPGQPAQPPAPSAYNTMYGGGALPTLAPAGYPVTPVLGGAPQPVLGGAPQPPPGAPMSTEDADRAHLEQIMRLRKELEREQERERQKKEEKQTWGCPTCTFKNKLDVVECEVCGAGRPGFSSAKVAQQEPPRRSQPPQSPATPSSAPAVVAPPPPAPGKWECKTCTYHNNSASPSCEMCGAPNPAPRAATTAPPIVDARPISATSPVPQAAVTAVWPCPTCTFENSFTSAKCSMCSTPMPQHLHAQAQIVARQAMILSGQNPYPAQRQPSATQPRTAGGSKTPAGRGAVVVPAQPAAAPRRVDDDGGEEVQWQDDNVVTNCNKCSAKFSMFVRRHHCRACGFVFCGSCCSNKIKLKVGGSEERVCIDCYREKLSSGPL